MEMGEYGQEGKGQSKGADRETISVEDMRVGVTLIDALP